MNVEGHEKCGTYAGKDRHRYYGTEVCAPCRAAVAVYMREYRRKRGLVGSVLVPLPLLRRAISEAPEPLATQLRSLLGGYAHAPRPGEPGHADATEPPGTPPE